MEARVAPAAWTTEQFDAMQIRAAEKARTVGAFQKNVHTAAIDLLENGGDAGVIASRMDAILHATKDRADLCIRSTDTGVLGYNTIGAGRDAAVLSAEMFASVTTLDDALQAQHTAEHEARHGEQVVLHGDIVFRHSVVDTLTMLEGDAELAANARVGMGPREHRDGQPVDVYGEGQAVVYAMQQVVGAQLMTRVFTETGDVTALQEALDAAGEGSVH